ncbi:MAG: PEP/pyruvate-binding domain-containing protein, partial [Daejeonella sp.]|nr:PEP/pyruvate-binding domain-containing protein [Daejeonella sp.]
MPVHNYIIPFKQISIEDLPKVGGKNASLGEMFNQLSSKGINIPDGFALSADAYRLFRKEKKNKLSLNRAEVILLAKWCLQIEEHYRKAMDIEWAKDGLNKQLYIVQARPETVHAKGKKQVHEIFKLNEKSKSLASGIALGDKIASGKARILKSPLEGDQLLQSEILVTDITNPDWDPILKKAAAIVTNKGGRTSHAAIVARELGTVAVVDSGNATEVIKNGDEITVSCADGKDG